MEFIPVISSNLSAVAYDEESKTLYIRFHSSGTYAYSNVTDSVFQGLLGAASKGGYHADFIKNRYPYKKL